MGLDRQPIDAGRPRPPLPRTTTTHARRISVLASFAGEGGEGMRSDAGQSSRDLCLGVAAAVLVVSQLLGLSGTLTFFAIDWSGFFLADPLVAGSYVLGVCSLLLQVSGFAAIGVALFDRREARGPRLRLGALVLAGGYGSILVSRAITLFLGYRSTNDSLLHLPAWLQASMILQCAAYLPALVAALLVARAFGRPRTLPGMEAAARNRWLGRASIGFGVEFALLLLSRHLGWPIWDMQNLVDTGSAAYALAVAAAVVAAIGFFGAANAYRLPLPRALPRREGFLATAAGLMVLHQVLYLIYLAPFRAGYPSEPLLEVASSRLEELQVVAVVVAALCAVLGFLLSRRSLLGRGQPASITGDD